MLKFFTLAQVQAYETWSKMKREDGQTMAEYAIVLGVIVIAVLSALGFLSGAIQGGINHAASLIP